MRSNQSHNKCADDKVPEEAQKLILSNLALPELAKISTVSTTWLRFFKMTKEEEKIALFKEFEDPLIYMEVSLSELRKKLAPHLAGITKQDKIKLFVLLKSIEEKILNCSTSAGWIGDEEKQLQMTFKELREYLTEQFGIAARFNSMSLDWFTTGNSVESRGEGFALFAALETVLKANKDQDALGLINSYLITINKVCFFKGFTFTNELRLHYGGNIYLLSGLRSEELERCNTPCQKEAFINAAADAEKKLLDQLYPEEKTLKSEGMLASFGKMI